MKFRGFRASLNFSTGKRITSEYSENVTPVAVNGAYRLKRDEFYGSGSYLDPPKKITPAMVKLPPAFQPDPTDPDVIRASKSTSDLTQPSNAPQINVPFNLRKSTPDVSTDPRGGTNYNRDSAQITKSTANDDRNQEKEQKKLDKKKIAEQKKREKSTAKERAKQDKMRKERAKAEMQEQVKQDKLRKEREKQESRVQAKQKKSQTDQEKAEIQLPTNPLAKNPMARTLEGGQKEPTAPGPSTAYTTNTLDSSISKTSGPPPYEATQPLETVNRKVVVNENDDTGNTSFGKPIDSSDTWDMIAQHRQQLTRAPVAVNRNKVMLNMLSESDTEITGRKPIDI